MDGHIGRDHLPSLRVGVLHVLRLLIGPSPGTDHRFDRHHKMWGLLRLNGEPKKG